MSFAVNNNLVSLAAAIVFANSSSYHVELPMAGREEESKTLREALELEGPRLVTMTAPLGAGKTFFLDTVLRKFELEGSADFDEKRSRHLVFATSVTPPHDHPTTLAELEEAAGRRPDGCRSLAEDWDRSLSGEPKVLIIEEIDRKAALGQICWTVAAAQEWLELGGNRLLILTGEVLRHPVLQPALESIEPRFHIALEPLEIDLLQEALKLRIRDKVITPKAADLDPEEAERLAGEAAEAAVADAYVRWSALPSTRPNVLANFREALGALRQISELMPTDNAEKVEFVRRPLVRLESQAEGTGPLAAAIEEALMQELTRSIAAETAIEPLTTEALADLAGKPVDDRLARRAIHPLSRQGALTPLGIPFTQSDPAGEPVAYTEPFVPSYTLVHRALAELVKAES